MKDTKTPKDPSFRRSVSFDTFRHRGSATVEAAVIMPLLLFVFAAFYCMCRIYVLDNQIYQATMNTADYLAQYAYVEDWSEKDFGEVLPYGAAMVKLHSYLPKQEQLMGLVVGGEAGIVITDDVTVDEEGFINLRVNYMVRIPLPLLHHLYLPMEENVRQKAYVGYIPQEGEGDASGTYVYVTEYGEVYHTDRHCTHLELSIHAASENEAHKLRPCEYCGDADTGRYYVTDYGECYHTSLCCSGLKRTIRRVPLEEVSCPPCADCQKKGE